MKTFTLEVPRPVLWYITTNLTPEEQITHWRLTYHFGHVRRGRRAAKLTVILGIFILMRFALTSDLMSLLVASSLLAIALYSIKRYWRGHYAIGNRICRTAPERWAEVGQHAGIFYQKYRKGDPLETVTVQLPDD